MSEHTPTPWKIHGTWIVSENSPTEIACYDTFAYRTDEIKANAKFIVRAVNAYDELVEGYELILKFFEDYQIGKFKYPQTAMMAMAEIAQTALASAKGDD